LRAGSLQKAFFIATKQAAAVIGKTASKAGDYLRLRRSTCFRRGRIASGARRQDVRDTNLRLVCHF